MNQATMQRTILIVYLVLMNLLFPVLLLAALPVLLFVEKRRRTVPARLGFQRIVRPRKQPLWIHALSLGELLSCVPLVKELHRQISDRPIYLSVSTLSAWSVARDRLAGHFDQLVYFPYDLLWPVFRCVRRINPCLFVLIETDIWPGFLSVIRRRGIPSLLVNGRLSPATLRSCLRFHWLFRPAFNTFVRIFPQSRAEADRYRRIGVTESRIGHCGNLKFDIPPVSVTQSELQTLKNALGFNPQDPVLLAGSTHPGEETIIHSVFQRLRKRHPALKLLLVPRDPLRAKQVAAIFRESGYVVRCYSDSPVQSADVCVVNVLGKLAGLYVAADVAFIGGSLVHRGGQNPLEAAAAGKPVLFGPHMTNFPDISRLLLESGGAWQVRDEMELFARCDTLLADPEQAVETGRKGQSIVRTHSGTTRHVVEDIRGIISAPTARKNNEKGIP
ncbi:MAG: hypothetical protein DRH37_09345 [Deltaproteobacteria bacterium]|nr:MAG: hypothetical protein DRH37_09345 [Deltaproteobacteria bacterium]